MILTGFGRTKRMTERAAGQLPRSAEVLELDVNSAGGPRARAARSSTRAGGALDGLLHAIAYAPPDALGGGFLDTPCESAVIAYQTSAFSLKALAAGAARRCSRPAPDGAGVVGLDFDAGVAWPAYDWMGVAKAALEAVARYLARELGPHDVRVNLVSAGPVETLAAGGIPGFSQLAEVWSQTAPLPWDASDPGPVADAACFLLSPLARKITARDPARRRRLPRDGLSRSRRRAREMSGGAVLLTGATGFLGMDALARLIERDDDQIVVLVRAQDDEGARERLNELLARLYDAPPGGAARVRAVRGDLLEPGLGLSEQDRRWLIGSVERIIHCAASISFELPLEEAREINVQGVARVIELAREIAAGGSLRRLVHVSTAYVSGRHSGEFAEDDLDVGQEFRNTYERSKNEAEQLLAGASDLPLAIARPSIVVGDQRQRLDARLQRALLADARVRTGPARRGAGAGRLDRRLRAGRLRDRRHPRPARRARAPAAPTTSSPARRR